MKVRTLVTERLYYGIDALSLRAGTARVLTRVIGLPPEKARVSARNLLVDFGICAPVGPEFVDELVADGLLEAPTELDGDYRITERFVEFAAARVVEPLTRARAKKLLAQACELAATINVDWTRNPLEIECIAPFGQYMSRNPQLAELLLGIVVRRRAQPRRARWGRVLTDHEGAIDMRKAICELSSFIRVRVVSDTQQLPKPFAVAFHADSSVELAR